MTRILTCLLTLLGLNSACSQQNFESMGTDDFAALIKQSDVIVLDVRTSEEYAEGLIEGAVNIDYKRDDFLQKAQSVLPKNKTVAVYCRSGRRSAGAASLLVEAGYKVINLKGGIMGWRQAKLPVVAGQDNFITRSGKVLTFHALMHASLRITFDGKELFVDPVKQLGPRKVDYTMMPQADYIFVTHEHADHFDKDAISQLSSPSTQLITNRRCADMLGYGEVMANGDERAVDSTLSVVAVPAYNTTADRLQFHPKGRDNGYVLTVDGLRIYIAGDTEDIEEMSQLRDIDIAFLPCNQPYTMTVPQLVRAARSFRPKVLFPYHYGDTDVTGIARELDSDGIAVRVRQYQ